MVKIVIKKRVDLDFLGEDFKDSYLMFQSMPISAYRKLIEELDDVDNKQSLEITLKVLKDNYIEGMYNGEKITAEDLEQFDIETLITCLERFTGQSQSPKV